MNGGKNIQNTSHACGNMVARGWQQLHGGCAMRTINPAVCSDMLLCAGQASGAIVLSLLLLGLRDKGCIRSHNDTVWVVIVCLGGPLHRSMHSRCIVPCTAYCRGGSLALRIWRSCQHRGGGM